MRSFSVLYFSVDTFLYMYHPVPAPPPSTPSSRPPIFPLHTPPIAFLILLFHTIPSSHSGDIQPDLGFEIRHLNYEYHRLEEYNRHL